MREAQRSLRFLLDMGMPRRLAIRLRELGYDAVHLGDLRLHWMADDQIFLKAGQEGRIVLTLDLDFGRLATILKAHRVGVVIVRLVNPLTARIIARVEAVLESCGPELSRGAIVVVEDARHRVRLPADGRSPRQ